MEDGKEEEVDRGVTKHISEGERKHSDFTLTSTLTKCLLKVGEDNIM